MREQEALIRISHVRFCERCDLARWVERDDELERNAGSECPEVRSGAHSTHGKHGERQMENVQYYEHPNSEFSTETGIVVSDLVKGHLHKVYNA